MLKFTIKREGESYECKGYEQLQELLDVISKYDTYDFVCEINVEVCEEK